MWATVLIALCRTCHHHARLHDCCHPEAVCQHHLLHCQTLHPWLAELRQGGRHLKRVDHRWRSVSSPTTEDCWSFCKRQPGIARLLLRCIECQMRSPAQSVSPLATAYRQSNKTLSLLKGRQLESLRSTRICIRSLSVFCTADSVWGIPTHLSASFGYLQCLCITVQILSLKDNCTVDCA